MEFDWESHDSQPVGSLKVRDVEESFEDPFAVRLMPDTTRFAKQAPVSYTHLTLPTIYSV